MFYNLEIKSDWEYRGRIGRPFFKAGNILHAGLVRRAPESLLDYSTQQAPKMFLCIFKVEIPANVKVQPQGSAPHWLRLQVSLTHLGSLGALLSSQNPHTHLSTILKCPLCVDSWHPVWVGSPCWWAPGSGWLPQKDGHGDPGLLQGGACPACSR